MKQAQVKNIEVSNSAQLGRAGHKTIDGAGSLAATRKVVGVKVLQAPLVFSANIVTPNLPDDADISLVNYTINTEDFVDWLGDLDTVVQSAGKATWIFA